MLASASPQRRVALERLGVPFEVQPSDVAELAHGVPADVAVENALRKARAVRDARAAATATAAAALAGADPEADVEVAEAKADVAETEVDQWEVNEAQADEIVLGVDTLVTLDGAIYGKPRDEPHARATLRALSGATHQVMSGVALVRGRVERTALVSTEVRFRKLDDALLEWYLARGEWRERSGGYAIQKGGSLLVREVRGDYENVVGLPLATLLDLHPVLLDALA